MLCYGTPYVVDPLLPVTDMKYVVVNFYVEAIVVEPLDQKTGRRGMA